MQDAEKESDKNVNSDKDVDDLCCYQAILFCTNDGAKFNLTKYSTEGCSNLLHVDCLEHFL
eukprot:6271033-Ditylum_brightwellii.AAC.1